MLACNSWWVFLFLFIFNLIILYMFPFGIPVFSWGIIINSWWLFSLLIPVFIWHSSSFFLDHNTNAFLSPFLTCFSIVVQYNCCCFHFSILPLSTQVICIPQQQAILSIPERVHFLGNKEPLVIQSFKVILCGFMLCGSSPSAACHCILQTFHIYRSQAWPGVHFDHGGASDVSQ